MSDRLKRTQTWIDAIGRIQTPTNSTNSHKLVGRSNRRAHPLSEPGGV